MSFFFNPENNFLLQLVNCVSHTEKQGSRGNITFTPLAPGQAQETSKTLAMKQGLSHVVPSPSPTEPLFQAANIVGFKFNSSVISAADFFNRGVERLEEYRPFTLIPQIPDYIEEAKKAIRSN